MKIKKLFFNFIFYAIIFLVIFSAYDFYKGFQIGMGV